MEAAGDAAVEIATIQAERDVAIAEIHAEVASEAIEADAEDSEDVAWLGSRLAQLQENCDANTAAVISQQATLGTLTEAMETMREQVRTLTEALTLATSPPQPLPTPETLESEVDPSEAGTPDVAEEMPVPAEPPPQKVRRWL